MYKTLKEFPQSKTFHGVLIGIGIAIAALLIFQAGIFVGYRKAAFAFKFGDNYYRTFGDHGPRPFQVPVGEKFIDAHGAAGKIIGVSLPTFVVEGPDSVEKVIRIGEDTEIRRFRDVATSSDLVAGDFVVILGKPNENAEVDAKLIRIMPPPPDIGEINSKKP